MSAELTAVVLAGLPGTGKSALAELLAAALDAPVLDKDRVRAALFGPRHVSYSRSQDDFVMETLYAAVGHVGDEGLARWALIDGRTFTRASQLAALRAGLARANADLALIECTCAPDVARARIAAQTGEHAALNRSASLYDTLAARAESLPEPKLVLATDREELGPLAQRALEWLRAERHA